MTILASHGYLATLVFLICCFEISGISAAVENFSFSFNRFGKNTSFEENVALYGDSKVVNGGSSIRLTESVSPSWGRVMYKKPVNIFEGKAKSFSSFSTYFSFLMSNESGDGLAFVMVPSGLNLSVFGNNDNNSSSVGFSLQSGKNETEVLSVEFDISRNARYGDLSGNHVGSLASAKINSLSSGSNMVVNNGEKLQCWIDYEASSKRLEARLSESGKKKPVDPLISYSMDLSKLWKDEKILVGLSSYNKNASQTCNVYSWSFKLRHFPNWMHSQPLDPHQISRTETVKPLVVQKKRDCLLRILGALVLGAFCGTLGAMAVLYLWTICGSRRSMAVVPEECAVKPADLKYKKAVEVVVVDKAGEEEGKK